MTLVTCFKGRDGIVLAADSRGTIGDPRGLTAINDSHIKLFNLSKFVGIVSYGQAELAAQLITQIKAKLAPSDIYFTPIFERSREIAKNEYENWFKNIPREQRQVIGFIIAGFEEDAVSKMYYLSSPLDFAPQLCTTGIALGGIPQYATYLTHRLYNPEMPAKSLILLAAYVIAETATQDPKVGGPIRIAEIHFDRGYRELQEAEIREVLGRCSELNKHLREFFFAKED